MGCHHTQSPRGNRMAGRPNVQIYPMLSVRRGGKAIEFYVTAFAAGEVFRVGDENSGVVAKLSVGGAEFWVADEAPDCLNVSPGPLRPHLEGEALGGRAWY